MAERHFERSPPSALFTMPAVSMVERSVVEWNAAEREESIKTFREALP